ncbi:DUF1214 domain-containing protein [Aestuariivirga sp.]|uniref:DUF1214 domain-containing protein n=1 Tax=Aestuariivirga sp. TaxID=2650926 RepID=UPI0039E33577
MRRTFGGPIIVALGALAGLASAGAAITFLGVEPAVKGGPWDYRDIAPTDKASPYTLGHYLIGGRVPPASGQMRELQATRDNSGNTLDGDCDFILEAKQAPTLWWSIAATSGPARDPRGVISSDTAVAEADGRVVITVSRLPQTGNWLRPPSGSDYTLLYTIATPSAASSTAALPLFTITKGGC